MKHLDLKRETVTVAGLKHQQTGEIDSKVDIRNNTKY